MSDTTGADERFMARALELAERARGLTSPNPMVGAVVVADGQVVGEGFHAAAGQPHAEVEALAAAGDRARGATLYVTLEPCSHWGRTPPCAPAGISAAVRRVVAAIARDGTTWLTVIARSSNHAGIRRGPCSRGAMQPVARPTIGRKMSRSTTSNDSRVSRLTRSPGAIPGRIHVRAPRAFASAT